MSWLRIKMKYGKIVYINLNQIQDISISKTGLKYTPYNTNYGILDLEDIEEVEFLSNTKAQFGIYVDLIAKMKGKKEKEEEENEEEEEK